jgi:ferric-dicitrate binding protein FerR (iron transport regulator)
MMPREEPTSLCDPITEEALAWFARAQSDRRTRADEDRLSHWLKQDSRHEAAYSRVTALYRAAWPST